LINNPMYYPLINNSVPLIYLVQYFKLQKWVMQHVKISIDFNYSIIQSVDINSIMIKYLV